MKKGNKESYFYKYNDLITKDKYTNNLYKYYKDSYNYGKTELEKSFSPIKTKNDENIPLFIFDTDLKKGIIDQTLSKWNGIQNDQFYFYYDNENLYSEVFGIDGYNQYEKIIDLSLIETYLLFESDPSSEYSYDFTQIREGDNFLLNIPIDVSQGVIDQDHSQSLHFNINVLDNKGTVSTQKVIVKYQGDTFTVESQDKMILISEITNDEEKYYFDIGLRGDDKYYLNEEVESILITDKEGNTTEIEDDRYKVYSINKYKYNDVKKDEVNNFSKYENVIKLFSVEGLSEYSNTALDFSSEFRLEVRKSYDDKEMLEIDENGKFYTDIVVDPDDNVSVKYFNAKLYKISGAEEFLVGNTDVFIYSIRNNYLISPILNTYTPKYFKYLSFNQDSIIEKPKYYGSPQIKELYMEVGEDTDKRVLTNQIELKNNENEYLLDIGDTYIVDKTELNYKLILDNLAEYNNMVEHTEQDISLVLKPSNSEEFAYKLEGDKKSQETNTSIANAIEILKDINIVISLNKDKFNYFTQNYVDDADSKDNEKKDRLEFKEITNTESNIDRKIIMENFYIMLFDKDAPKKEKLVNYSKYKINNKDTKIFSSMDLYIPGLGNIQFEYPLTYNFVNEYSLKGNEVNHFELKWKSDFKTGLNKYDNFDGIPVVLKDYNKEKHDLDSYITQENKDVEVKYIGDSYVIKENIDNFSYEDLNGFEENLAVFNINEKSSLTLMAKVDQIYKGIYLEMPEDGKRVLTGKHFEIIDDKNDINRLTYISKDIDGNLVFSNSELIKYKSVYKQNYNNNNLKYYYNSRQTTNDIINDNTDTMLLEKSIKNINGKDVEEQIRVPIFKNEKVDNNEMIKKSVISNDYLSADKIMLENTLNKSISK